MKKYNENIGITLIALVVSIIVLLILTGISFSMLTGQNGILRRASEAKEETEKENIEEKRKLAQTEALMSKEDTNYKGVTVPKGFAPTRIKGEDSLDTGLVITDENGNEYVWVEVPKTIYQDIRYNINGIPESADDWERIRDCLKSYTADYSNSAYKDTNLDGETYSDDYKNMLKSVYNNGGFWIGRYEAGLEVGKNPRTSYVAIAESDNAVVKPNMYPYNYITRDEAQALGKRMNYDGCTSSLIFGVQWDLILKYIETRNATLKVNLMTDSTTVGNYYNSEITLSRGKFAQYGALSNWHYYNSTENVDLVTENKKKIQSSSLNAILLTTGVSEQTNLQNIYDIAGNVYEWTLEFYDASYPCISRGGSYDNNGSVIPAKYRNGGNTNSLSSNIGFRIGLWK